MFRECCWSLTRRGAIGILFNRDQKIGLAIGIPCDREQKLSLAIGLPCDRDQKISLAIGIQYPAIETRNRSVH